MFMGPPYLSEKNTGGSELGLQPHGNTELSGVGLGEHEGKWVLESLPQVPRESQTADWRRYL